MKKQTKGDAKRGFKPEKETPWRIAPRLSAEVKNKGITERKKPLKRST